jgi:hypothetical protein
MRRQYENKRRWANKKVRCMPQKRKQINADKENFVLGFPVTSTIFKIQFSG